MKSTIHLRISSAFVMAGVSVALSACDAGSTHETLATVFAAEAEVTVERKNNVTDVTSAACLAANDVVRTGKNSILRLSFVPGVLGEIASNSVMKLIQLSLAKNGNAMTNAMRSRQVRVRLFQGSLNAVVEESDTPDVMLIVDTTAGLITASSGSLFQIEIVDQRVRILCVRGAVHVQGADGASMTVAAGFLKNLPSDNGEAAPASEEVKAQSDIEAVLEADLQLRALENRARFTPKPWRQFILK